LCVVQGQHENLLVIGKPGPLFYCLIA